MAQLMAVKKKSAAPKPAARLPARATAEAAVGWHAPIRDTDRATPKKLGALLAGVVALETNYISHGEYLEGLSPDGRSWTKDLARRYTDDIRAMLTGVDDESRLAEARDFKGALLGLAVVAFNNNGAELCWIIEDMAVLPTARGQGVGHAFMTFIAAEAKKAGAKKLMLESGVENHGAHRLFEATGFKLYSKVFVRSV
jgi:GNAT superfamily N-acetyltransferase